MTCPCGSGADYDECCGPLHRHERTAGSAEALMRSRYSAFAVGDADYLRETWDAATRPAEITLDPGVRWTRLRVLHASEDGDTGVVEFRAHYRHDGEPHSQTERSLFRRVAGRWRYVEAQ